MQSFPFILTRGVNSLLVSGNNSIITCSGTIMAFQWFYALKVLCCIAKKIHLVVSELIRINSPLCWLLWLVSLDSVSPFSLQNRKRKASCDAPNSDLRRSETLRDAHPGWHYQMSANLRRLGLILKTLQGKEFISKKRGRISQEGNEIKPTVKMRVSTGSKAKVTFLKYACLSV